ncbi:ChaN family lipoprotein [Roseobacter insulae]|uniref:ChaN family lipoprotein n=1 Tax=Roseobacter insulae TaxID=2859783 RepID=UPI0021519B66|nr:ChaN family lipoprotein [Roseobacter insulae]
MAAPYVVAETPDVRPVPEAAAQADVVFIGEQHDNPWHHEVQAAWVQTLRPAALVFEMLTPEQAHAVTADNRTDITTLRSVLDWDQSGWPDFAMYYPIFSAAPSAAIYGAGVPRDQVRDMMGMPLSEAFGVEQASLFGLDRPLPEDQRQLRENIQRVAHCNALPEDLLPKMVAIQRLRDAVLARAARTALAETGGPVVVITGNGHARMDWGAPHALAQASPDIAVFALGQGEAGADPDGVFDATQDGPAVDRGDPCDAFN